MASLVFSLTPPDIAYKKEAVLATLLSTNDLSCFDHLPKRILFLGRCEYTDVTFTIFPLPLSKMLTIGELYLFQPFHK